MTFIKLLNSALKYRICWTCPNQFFLRDIVYKMYVQFTMYSSIILKIDDIVKGWDRVAVHAISNMKGQIEAFLKITSKHNTSCTRKAEKYISIHFKIF